AADMDILFPLSVIDTELCPSPVPQIIHLILFVGFSLVFLIILSPYFPREPSSVPPREENSENDQGEVGEWLRIGNKYITWKDCRSLLKELENLEFYTFLSKKCLRKLLVEGSSHHLPHQARSGSVYKRTSVRNHRPRGGRGKASPTRFHVSPRAPPAPLASAPSSVLKTSVGSFESLSSLSSSKPPEPLHPLKQPSHQPPVSTLSPNMTTSAESLGETPHEGRWRQGPLFPQLGCANTAGRTRHQNPRHSHGHGTS
uniref:SPATA31 subfamily J member 1 n=1 Tax=Rhinopithecus roxellana TaxID=61622 RepID=A0A2K6Q8L8_RHIRO